MAQRGSLSFVERHVEKGVLGLAVAFLLGVGVYYLVLEPNKVEFDGQQLKPGELDEAILRRAERLRDAVGRVEADVPDVPTYSQQLQQQFDEGILAATGPGGTLPDQMPGPYVFNTPLAKFDVEGEKNIKLVTPLQPTNIAVRTGISQVYRQPFPLITANVDAAVPAEIADEPEERSWVSLAAYFPVEAQQKEMIANGYAGYLAKVHIVGVDVERQEMTASGEFGEWQPVEVDRAVPQVELPAPVFDERTDEIVNQEELEAARSMIRARQPSLMQPPFYPVIRGDEWEVPPLPGHEPQEEEEEEDDEQVGLKRDDRDRKRPLRPAGSPRTGGTFRPGGMMGPGGPGGGLIGPGGPTGMAPQSAGGGAQANPRKVIAGKLKDARKALRDKDWAQAETLARSVASNPEASKSDVRKADRIIRDAQKGREKPQQVRPDVTGPVPRMLEPVEFIANPETEDPAVFFHDDTVAPGKTYRYRMRVRLWNRYVGRRAALRDPSQAEKTLLEGEWSLPSAPVTVAPKRHFFVVAQQFGQPVARVEVFTWHEGNWLRESFDASVGDVIGGSRQVKTGKEDDRGRSIRETVDFSTDVIVLDLRIDEPVLNRRTVGRKGEFDYRDTQSLVLVYLDPADGQVKERIDDVDKTDPLYKKLKDEWDLFKDSL